MVSFPRWLRLALAALLPCLMTGCLEFEKQTVYVAFPKDRDEVDALLVYEGVGVEGNNPEALTEAKKQLEPFAKEQAFCLWVWPLAIDLTPEPKDPPEQKQLKELLRKHLTIKNGAFFTSADGKLNAYQTITIRDVSKLIATTNDMISESILNEKPAEPKPPEVKPGEPKPPEPKKVDKETQELIRKAARNHYAWAKLTPGQLSVNIPMTPAAARELKRKALGVDELDALLKAWAENKAEKPEEKDRIRNQIDQLKTGLSILADNPISFDQRKDHITVALGVGDGQPIRVDLNSTPPHKEPTKLDKDLADYAKTLSIKFRKDVTVDTIIDEFRKEHGGKKGE